MQEEHVRAAKEHRGFMQEHEAGAYAIIESR